MATRKVNYTTVFDRILKLGVSVYNFDDQIKCDFTKKLGDGMFMNVYEGNLTTDGKKPVKVALKRPKYDIMPKTHDRRFNVMLIDIQQELRMLKHFESHPNIIDLYGVTFKDLKPILVVELAVDTLRGYLRKRINEKPVDWQIKKRFCCEISDGLMAIHMVNVVHGDIKGDNILLFPDQTGLVAKISDFGFSRTRASISRGQSTVGTRRFFAPECAKPHSPGVEGLESPSKDKYAYGLVVWQIAMDGQDPFDGMSLDEMDELKHTDKNLDTLMGYLDKHGVPEEFRTVIAAMTRYDPEQRDDLQNVQKMMKSDNPRYAKARAALEALTRELPQDLEMAKVDQLTLTPIPPFVKSKLASAYEAAASEGDPVAASYISTCYGSGFGLNISEEKMILWAVKASEWGSLDVVMNIVSQFEMVELLEYIDLLFPWLLKAAEIGHHNSQYIVSWCYQLGKGVERDRDKAQEWVERHETNTRIIGPQLLLDFESNLHRAAREGNLQMIKYIIQQENTNVDTVVSSYRGQTSLHVASEKGNEAAVIMLVEQFHADVEKKDGLGRTALYIAASKGHARVVEVLRKQLGADIEARDNYDGAPLHSAALQGHVEVVALLCGQFYANVDVKDQDGQRPLHYAAENGHVEIAKLLIVDFGADVNIKDKNGVNPLRRAAENGHVEFVKLLVADFGVDVNDRDINGRTPLHGAAELGHGNVVIVLVEQFHADVNARDNSDQTPLDLALEEFGEESNEMDDEMDDDDIQNCDTEDDNEQDLHVEDFNVNDNMDVVSLLRNFSAILGSEMHSDMKGE